MNATLTKYQVVEDSCDFHVMVLPVSAVICHHQFNTITSTVTLIHVLCLGVPLASQVCCLCRHDMIRALVNPCFIV